MTIDDIMQACGSGVGKAVQMSILKNAADNHSRSSVDALRIGCNAVLNCLQATAPFLCKRPSMTETEMRAKGAQTIVDLIKTETLLMAALIAVRQFQGLKLVNPCIEREGSMVAEADSTCEFGPDILYEALEDWKKLTGQDPAKYFDPRMLEAIEEVSKGATVPLDEFIAKRKTAQEPPKTLQ